MRHFPQAFSVKFSSSRIRIKLYSLWVELVLNTFCIPRVGLSMARSEAAKILQNAHDFLASMQAERLVDSCPKTVAALHALEAAVSDEFEAFFSYFFCRITIIHGH